MGGGGQDTRSAALPEEGGSWVPRLLGVRGWRVGPAGSIIEGDRTEGGIDGPRRLNLQGRLEGRGLPRRHDGSSLSSRSALGASVRIRPVPAGGPWWCSESAGSSSTSPPSPRPRTRACGRPWPPCSVTPRRSWLPADRSGWVLRPGLLPAWAAADHRLAGWRMGLVPRAQNDELSPAARAYRLDLRLSPEEPGGLQSSTGSIPRRSPTSDLPRPGGPPASTSRGPTGAPGRNAHRRPAGPGPPPARAGGASSSARGTRPRRPSSASWRTPRWCPDAGRGRQPGRPAARARRPDRRL